MDSLQLYTGETQSSRREETNLRSNRDIPHTSMMSAVVPSATMISSRVSTGLLEIKLLLEENITIYDLPSYMYPKHTWSTSRLIIGQDRGAVEIAGG